MIAYLARKRFNMIDALALIWVALAWRDENWLAVAVIAIVFPILSVLAERSLPEPPKETP